MARKLQEPSRRRHGPGPTASSSSLRRASTSSLMRGTGALGLRAAAPGREGSNASLGREVREIWAPAAERHAERILDRNLGENVAQNCSPYSHGRTDDASIFSILGRARASSLAAYHPMHGHAARRTPHAARRLGSVIHSWPGVKNT